MVGALVKYANVNEYAFGGDSVGCLEMRPARRRQTIPLICFSASLYVRSPPLELLKCWLPVWVAGGTTGATIIVTLRREAHVTRSGVVAHVYA